MQTSRPDPEPKPTDLVYIELADGKEANYTTRLIAVGGTFSLKMDDPRVKPDESETTDPETGAKKPKKDYGGVIYHIEADYLR